MEDNVLTFSQDEIEFSMGSKLRNCIEGITSDKALTPSRLPSSPSLNKAPIINNKLHKILEDRKYKMINKYSYDGAEIVDRASAFKPLGGRAGRALKSIRNRTSKSGWTSIDMLKGDDLVNARNLSKAQRTKLQNARTLANKIRKAKATGNKK